MRKLYQRFIFAGLLLASGFCFWKAAPGLLSDFALLEPVADAALTTTSLETRGPLETSLKTTPIQELRVGMRVSGRNPSLQDVDRDWPEPDTNSWRLVQLRMEHSPGKFVELELLRPEEWIDELDAEGGDDPWLEIPEMLVAGNAEIIAVEQCPPLDDGAGPIITGTFRHEANDLLEVVVEGTGQPLVCTSQHPFWSMTRDDFIEAEQLQVEELVLTAHGGSARVIALRHRTGSETVYGLEVYGEHVYQVGSAGILVHNASSKLSAAKFANQKGRVKWVKENASMSPRASNYEMGATGARSESAPALYRRARGGKISAVKFDGVDHNAKVMIDRKLSVPAHRAKVQDAARRQSSALQQNGFTGRWEVASQAEANRANRMFKQLGIKNIKAIYVKES